MKIRAGAGICSISLENCCASIACVQLFLLVVAGMISPGLLNINEYKCSLVIAIAMSIVLLVASIFHLRWLLWSWSVYALLLLLGMPYGVETIAGFFRVLYSAPIVYNRFLSFTLEYILFTALYMYFLRMVLSYCVQLSDQDDQDQEQKERESKEHRQRTN